MVRVTTMGESRVSLRDINLRPGSGLSFSVVLYLAAEAGRYLTRSTMRAMFWPGVPEPVAGHSLRQAIYMIRRAGGKVTCDHHHVSLAADTVAMDYLTLVPDPSSNTSLLLRDFLPGYDPQISPEHERWVQSFKDRAQGHLRHMLIGALAQYRLLALWSDVEAIARRCLELDPLNEEATLALAEALAMAGRKLAALELLDSYRRSLGAFAPTLQLPVSVVRRRISDLFPDVRPAPRDTAFVGRASLLELLSVQVKQLKVSLGGGYHIWGPEGIGKTRLITEAIHHAILDGVKVINLTNVKRISAKAGAVFGQLVTELLLLPGAIGCSPSSLETLRRLLKRPSLTAPTAPEILQISIDALLDLADAVSHERPLLIVVDDMDRLDPASEKAITQLAYAVKNLPILLLCCSRTSPLSTAGEGPMRPIEVGQLARHESTNLLKALTERCGRGPSDDFLARCVAVAGGNPALLVDLASQWCANGTGFRFPATVIAAITKRLSDLTDDSLGLLRLCAVLGSQCTVERVLRTELYDSAQISKAVEQLDRAGLVAFDKATLLVADPAVSEQVLGGLRETALRYLNHISAIVLESELQVPEYQPLVWHCASHHSRAGNSARAVDLLTTCADSALRESRLAEAIGILQRAKELCSTPFEQLAISEQLVRAQRKAEHWKQVLQTAQLNAQHRRDSRLHGNHHDDVELASLAARWHLDQPAAALIKEISNCLLDEDNSPDHRTAAAVQLLIFAHNMGDETTMRFAHGIALGLTSPNGESSAALTAEMIYQTAVGDVSAAAAVGEQLLRAARSTLDPSELALTLRQVALPLRFSGRFNEARDLLAEALKITNALGASYGCVKAADMIGTTFLEEGRLSEAWEWYVKSTQWAGGPGDPNSATYSRNLGAKIALLQNKMSVAAKLTRQKPKKILKRSVLRLRCDELAIWVAFSLQRGVRKFDKPVIAAFESDFERLKRLGNQDFTVYALASLRRTTIGDAAAASLLSDYLSERREMSRPPAFLLELQHSLGGSQCPTSEN